MKSIKYWILHLGDKMVGTKIIKWYQQIDQMQNWSRHEIETWQKNKLRELISHSYNNIPFYHNYFNQNNLHPSDITDFGKLELLPIITKEMIRNNPDNFSSKNKTKIKHKRSATGGSTAEPLIFLRDYDSWSYTAANSLYYWEKIGYKLGDKYAAFGSSNVIPNSKLSVLHRLYYKVNGKIALSGINFNESAIRAYVDIIKNNNIQFLYGYSSAIYLLAKYLKKNNIKLNLKGCISTSELLLKEYRNLISEVMGCKILDAYGAGDSGVTAFNYNNKFFEVGYSTYVEIDQDKRIISTDLLNYSMPFIRYEVGDAAESDDTYSLDYNGQVINSLFGRIPNVLQFNNGVELIGPAFPVLFSDVNVDAFKIKKISDMEIGIEIVRGRKFSDNDESLILNAMRTHIGSEIKITLLYKSSFDQQKSGKRDYFLSSGS